MGYDDIRYSKSFFGYCLPFHHVFGDEDEDEDEEIYKKMKMIQAGWNDYVKKHLHLSGGKSIDISGLEFFEFYDSLMACYEVIPRDPRILLFGYEIDKVKYKVNESENGRTCTFNFNFPPKIEEFYVEFLTEFSSNFLAPLSADEREKMMTKIREAMEFGVCGSVETY